MTQISVLIIDDHDLVRSMLKERLSSEENINVIAAVAGANEGVEIALTQEPQVIVMDIDMPGLHPFDAARKILKEVPDAHIIFLSGFCQDSYIAQALEIGARGYITKTESPSIVVEAINEVARGQVWFSEEVRDRVVYNSKSGVVEKPVKTRGDTLTPREIEVLRYTAQGLPKKEIARLMNITYKTVEKHSSNLMEKLSLHDRVEITRYAIREGLVEA